ncbi:MAG: protein-disulfide reductase DsbD domain-containing protein [Phycisphaerales bacterium]
MRQFQHHHPRQPPRCAHQRLTTAAAALLLAATAFSTANAQPGKTTPPNAPSNTPTNSPFNTTPQKPETGNDHAAVALISELTAIRPAHINWIALDFTIAEGWHLYWKFAGDTGIPPVWSFDTPDGITIGNPIWPAPTAYSPSSQSLDYIHERRLTLLFPLIISSEAAQRAQRTNTPITITTKVDWLVCKDICLPGQDTATITLPVQPTDTTASAAPTPHAPRFAHARAQTPLTDQDPARWGIDINWDTTDPARPTLTISAPPDATAIRWIPDEQQLRFLPRNRIADTAAQRNPNPTTTTTATEQPLRLTIPHRPDITKAPHLKAILQLTLGHTTINLGLTIPPPPPAPRAPTPS